MAEDTGGFTQNDADLLWKAMIDDATQPFFDKFDENINKAEQTANTGFEGVANATDKANTKFAVLAGVIAGITTVLAQVAIHVVTAAAELVGESYKITAAYDKVGASMYIVGQNAGYSITQMDAFEKKLNTTSVSGMGARESLIKMAQANIDLGKSYDIAVVAQDASAVSGQSVDSAMQGIVRSIQLLSPLLLRTMGIYVDLTAEYKKYAAAHNIDKNMLDERTKQQIMLNAVLEKGKDIQGAYEAALKTAAGQQQLQVSLMEDLHIAAGRVIQPIYLAWLETVNKNIVALTKYLDDNKEAINRFGNDVGAAFKLIVDSAGDMVTATKGFIDDVADELQLLLKSVAGKEATKGGFWDFLELDTFVKRLTDVTGILETFNKSLIFTRAIIAGINAEGFGGVLKHDIEVLYHLLYLLTASIPGGNSEVAKREAAWLQDRNRQTAEGTKFMDAFNESMKESLTLMPDLTKVTNENEAALAKQAAALKAEAEAVNAVDTALEALKKKLDEDAANRAIKKTRDAIESALRDAWQQEDMSRQLADNIAKIEQNRTDTISQINENLQDTRTQIEKNGQESRISLIKQYAEQQWQIEHNYALRLQQMKENFEYQASELSRSRDAVSLLRLSRQYDKDLKDTKKSKDEQLKDAQRNYGKAVEDLNDSISKQEKAATDAYKKQLQRADEAYRKQLKEANKAYDKQQEELKRSKDREKIIQDLHDKWVLEDIQRSTDKELQKLIDQYNNMDGATVAGLQTLLNDWGTYFTNLQSLIDVNVATANAKIASIARPSERGGTFPATAPLSNPRPSERGGVVGQAGLVTSMLTPFGGMRPAALEAVPVSRLPTVQPGSSSDYRKLDINVAGNALDPYIQRVLVRTLAEIERNRS